MAGVSGTRTRVGLSTIKPKLVHNHYTTGTASYELFRSCCNRSSQAPTHYSSDASSWNPNRYCRTICFFFKKKMYISITILSSFRGVLIYQIIDNTTDLFFFFWQHAFYFYEVTDMIRYCTEYWIIHRHTSIWENTFNLYYWSFFSRPQIQSFVSTCACRGNYTPLSFKNCLNIVKFTHIFLF